MKPKRPRGRPRGLKSMLVYVGEDTEAWLRREAERTKVFASNIVELALLRLRHSRPDAGLAELRKDAHAGKEISAAAVSDNPAVAAVLRGRKS